MSPSNFASPSALQTRTSNIKPGLQSGENVFTVTQRISRCGAWTTAIELLQTSKSLRIPLNLVSYNACMNVLRQTWPFAELLLAESQRSFLPDVTSFGVMTSAYAEKKQWMKALRMLDQGHADEISFSVAASVFHWLRGFLSLQMMSGRRMRPDLTNHNTVLANAGAAGAWTMALVVKECINHLRLGPDVITYNGSISACHKAAPSEWLMAFSLLQTMRPQPDVISFNACLGSSASLQPWTECLHLVELMKIQLIQPDAFSFSTLIDACGHEWQMALRALGLQIPNLVSCNAAITACALGIQWEKALLLLFEWQNLGKPRGRPRDVISFSAAITACQRLSKWQQAIHLLRTSLPDFKIAPDTLCFYGVLSSCANAQKWQAARDFLQEMVLKRLDDHISHAAVNLACQQAGRWQIVLESMFTIEMAGDVVAWTALADASQDGQQWNLAMKTYDSMNHLALRDMAWLQKRSGQWTFYVRRDFEKVCHSPESATSVEHELSKLKDIKASLLEATHFPPFKLEDD
eukprot:symbB.v1.2.034452.t1/scaffold4448.1/size41344/2